MSHVDPIPPEELWAFLRKKFKAAATPTDVEKPPPADSAPEDEPLPLPEISAAELPPPPAFPTAPLDFPRDFPAAPLPELRDNDAPVDANPPNFPPNADALLPPTTMAQEPPSWIGKVWSRFGGDGFLISVGIHALLFVLALTWVVSIVVVEEKKTENFATGAGGGAGGERANSFEHRVKMAKPRNLVKSVTRITSRSSTATITAPDLSFSSPQLLQGNTHGDLSKGLGGGTGGGEGRGIGIGKGNGQNLVSKFVFGMRMQASNVAVYLDSSGSMQPYLDAVKAAILEQYPDADIFEHPHIAIKTWKAKVLGGLNESHAPTALRGKTASARQRSTRLPESAKRPSSTASRAKTRKKVKGLDPPENPLTPQGMKIYVHYASAFDAYSVGAWTDIMMYEDYDALVIFSDFQDGVMLQDPKSTAWSRERLDDDTSAEWCRRWRERFAEVNKAPKLYLISIQRKPQKIWQECVEASGGEIKMMPVERKRRGAKTAKGTEEKKLPPAPSPKT